MYRIMYVLEERYSVSYISTHPNPSIWVHRQRSHEKDIAKTRHIGTDVWFIQRLWRACYNLFNSAYEFKLIKLLLRTRIVIRILRIMPRRINVFQRVISDIGI